MGWIRQSHKCDGWKSVCGAAALAALMVITGLYIVVLVAILA